MGQTTPTDVINVLVPLLPPSRLGMLRKSVDTSTIQSPATIATLCAASKAPPLPKAIAATVKMVSMKPA